MMTVPTSLNDIPVLIYKLFKINDTLPEFVSFHSAGFIFGQSEMYALWNLSFSETVQC